MLISEKRISSRRNVLKTPGVGIATTGMAGQVSAQRSPREIFNQGLKIREETGSEEKFEKYILNHGFEISHSNTETYPFEEPDGGLSIQHAEKPNLELQANLYQKGDYSKAYGSWYVYRDTSDAWNDFDDTGKKPVDIIGLGWEHSDYDLKWGTWDSGSNTSQRSASTNDVVWEFDDYQENLDEADADDRLYSGYVSAELDPTNPIDERSIIVNYMYTWVGGEITGVSIDSSGGMSVGVSLSTKKWDTPKQAHSNP